MPRPFKNLLFEHRDFNGLHDLKFLCCMNKRGKKMGAMILNGEAGKEDMNDPTFLYQEMN